MLNIWQSDIFSIEQTKDFKNEKNYEAMWGLKLQIMVKTFDKDFLHWIFWAIH